MSANRKKLLWPAVIVVTAIFTALLLVSASTGATDSPNISPTSAAVAEKPAPASPPQTSSAEERLEGELVVVGVRGFEPAEITRPAGPFLLIVDNRTGLDEVQVRVERVAGRERLYDVGLSRKDYSWNTLLRLPPGDYILTEAGHPDWVCRLTLTSS